MKQSTMNSKRSEPSENIYGFLERKCREEGWTISSVIKDEEMFRYLFLEYKQKYDLD